MAGGSEDAESSGASGASTLEERVPRECLSTLLRARDESTAQLLPVGSSWLVRALLILSGLSSADAFPFAARNVGVRIYCITVRCDAALEDLSLWSVGGILGLIACGLVTSAALFACSRRSIAWQRFTAMASALLAVAVLALPVFLFVHLQRMRTLASLTAASHEQTMQRLHLHSCWDSCHTANFTVYVHGMRRRHQHSPLWLPPSSVSVAASPAQACVVVVPRSLTEKSSSLEWVAQLPGWRNGRNHIFVDQSDQGTTLHERLRWLGCAAIGQSHMELTNFVPGFDISIPLDGSRMGLPALAELSVTHAHIPSSMRPYWLTFRGTTYVNDGGEGARRTGLLKLVNLSSAAKKIVVVEQCHKLHGMHKHAAYRDLCNAYDKAMEVAPSYLTLLNSTFALVPGGRQPASIRLNEVLAAAAIPVFISGDMHTTSPYVLPFDGVLDWGKFSFHFSWDDPLDKVVRALSHVDEMQLNSMQRHLRYAWKRFLQPMQSSQTFYELLERHARRGSRRE